MNAKRGYKLTEAGPLPEDWQSTLLPDIVWFQEGPGLRKWQFRSTGVKVINVTNLQLNGRLDLATTDRHISWDDCDRAYRHFLIDAGDVVMASSGNSYGKTAVVRDQDLPLLMNTSVIRFKPKDPLDPDFMLICLRSRIFKEQIDLMITGGAQPNFGPAHLRKVLIPLPPTKSEQRAIATALSDADALIESLEQLIAKKRQIKQGAMQELLTGKRRLPGFNGEWAEPILGDLFAFKNGLNKSKRFFGFGTPIVNYMDVYRGGGILEESLVGRVSLTREEIRTYDVRRGDVFFTRTSETLSEIGIAAVMLDAPKDTVFSGFVLRARPVDDTVVDRFKQYCFAADYVRKQITSQSSETTRALTNGRSLSRVRILMPKVTEQAAIADVLDRMALEIGLLEFKLSKTRALKQGMMQELLTGRIRLV